MLDAFVKLYGGIWNLKKKCILSRGIIGKYY